MYQVINPMDLNRNYSNNHQLINNQSQSQQQIYDSINVLNTNDHNNLQNQENNFNNNNNHCQNSNISNNILNTNNVSSSFNQGKTIITTNNKTPILQTSNALQIPTTTMAKPATVTISKSYYSQIKRTKLSHINEMTQTASPSSNTTCTLLAQNSIQNKQETMCQNENDLNENDSSSNNVNIFNDYSKQLIITKLEPFQIQSLNDNSNHNNNNNNSSNNSNNQPIQLQQCLSNGSPILNVNTGQINLIKIKQEPNHNGTNNSTSSTTTISNLINNSAGSSLKLPVTTKITTTANTNDNTQGINQPKTIIQYKQLLTNGTLSSTIKTQQNQLNSQNNNLSGNIGTNNTTLQIVTNNTNNNNSNNNSAVNAIKTDAKVSSF